MKKRIALISSLLLLVGCSNSTAGAINMNVLDFSKKITEPGVVILDVRTPSEVAEGYIEDAQNIDFQSGSFENEIAALNKDVTYAVYCRSGNRSGQAVKIMHDAGFHNVYNLEGGVIDWVNQGMPLINN
jgi:rhodanese-related sulfurtransferase